MLSAERLVLNDFCEPAARAVAEGKCERGIVICTTGIGASITANKVKGVRCALCSEPWSAQMTRRHNLFLEHVEEALPLLVVMLLQGFAELPQGLLLLPVEAPGGLDVYGDELVAPSPAVDHGDALALEPEGGAGLGALGQGVGHLAVDGGDLQEGA